MNFKTWKFESCFTPIFILLMAHSALYAQKINGLTIVAPPRPIGASAFQRASATHADWVALVPYAFQRKGETEIRYDLGHQWWGEGRKGLGTCIALATDNCMAVMVKPQLYIPGSWTGAMDFSSDMAWTQWEVSYKTYIMSVLQVAIEKDASMFCIGTELKLAVMREKFWRGLINDIRNSYRGKIVYAANWDDYDQVPFWDALDYIGINAYFPLTAEKTPCKNTLDKAWKNIIQDLSHFAHKHDRQILFTEFGYLCTDRCAWKTWELESTILKLPANQAAQANALDALFKSVWHQRFFAGGFLWKWFPDGMGHEGYPDKDYDPQNKLGENILKKYYKLPFKN
ncbi:MAG: hypothetical protein IPN29_05105 [Saprospiraceae bacterium]|nr:hypothetical protein [Saprospiraceae bacterium]